MRQVEFKETYLHGENRFEPGDRKSFSDEEAATFIKIGVAKCVDTNEDHDRQPGAHVIVVQGIDLVI